MILFYVSGHGFGHMSRQGAVLQALRASRPEINFAVKTPTTPWFVRDSMPSGGTFKSTRLDVGILQKDSLNVDISSTLKAYADIIERKKGIIGEELSWCREQKVKLIVSDIPPLAFDIAQAGNIPSVCIANFSWDWIYRYHIEAYPEYYYIIEDIQASENKCTLLLYTPFSGDLCAFPHQQAIPLICRKSFLTKEEARLRAGLPLDRKILLISFGGLGLNEHFPLEPDISGDVILLFNPKREGLKYQDLVKAVDAVLTKPGYGIVSECIANRTPILYVDRGLFPEFDILDKEMGKYIPAQKIPLQDFFTGRWKPYWDKLLDDRTEKSSISLEGAEKAVQIFLDFY